jgi:hypothetical protein
VTDKSAGPATGFSTTGGFSEQPARNRHMERNIIDNLFILCGFSGSRGGGQAPSGKYRDYRRVIFV